MKVKEITEPVFRTNLIFVYDCSAKKFKELLEKREVANIDKLLDQRDSGVMIKVLCKNGVYEYYLWVEEKDGFYTLSHEIIHLVAQVLDRVGIPFFEGNEELVAYYHEYWMRKLWHIMGKDLPERRG